MSAGLELEHLQRLLQDLRDAIQRAREVGASPACAITCLSAVTGEIVAQSGQERPDPALLTSIAQSIVLGCRSERARMAQKHPLPAFTQVYRAGAARRLRK